MSYPIPSAAVDVFTGKEGWDNASLVFDRYAPIIPPKDTIFKKQGFVSVLKARRDKGLHDALRARWRAMIATSGATSFMLKTEWRFVSGVGRNTPYEVGFRFDRYGFATLPGSSVKGIARAYAWALGKREESDEDFRAVFGYAPVNANDKKPAQTGQAVFYDAMPIDDPKLKLDVMNPHYPKYYAGEEPPTNWQSPVPIYFLTVAPNVRFEFAVGWRGAPKAELHQIAVEWLKGGLTELGAGAKTNAGYGFFAQAALAQPAANTTAINDKSTQPKTEAPKGETKNGTGKLRRKGNKAYVVDGGTRYEARVEHLGVAAFNGLPADGADVAYEYDETAGTRRIWKVTKKPNLKVL